MVKSFPVILSLIFLFTFQSFAQDVTVNASTDKSSYLVGDYIDYTIEINYNKGTKVYPQFIKDSLKTVSIIQNENPVEEEKNGKVTAVYKYILSGYDSADVTIPQIPVLYQTAGDTTMHYALTNPVGFAIRTLKVNPQGDIRDVKDPIKIPLDWRWILFWVLLALLAAGAVYYFYRRYQSRKAAGQPVRRTIKLPPHAVALNALHELEEQKLWQKGMIKEYHSTITEIIRRYFEERFNLPAMELTTSEAMALLKLRKESQPIWDTTYNFLSNADMVKFAKFVPLGSVNEEMMKQAYEIVNKTIPVLVSTERTSTSNGDEKKIEVGNVQ